MEREGERVRKIEKGIGRKREQRGEVQCRDMQRDSKVKEKRKTERDKI